MNVIMQNRPAAAETVRDQRVPVAINVKVESTLAVHTGTITDLTAGGAKIMGQPFAVGTLVKIELTNGAIWGRVRWSEEDRYGVQFETPMPAQLAMLLKTRTPANDRQQAVRRFGKRTAI